jgi:ABC-type branched-subunit amino acid transport system ATPase component
LAGAGLVVIPLLYPRGIAGLGQQLWERFLDSVAAGLARRHRGATPDPLVVNRVSVSFGGLTALDGVDLTVGPGEIVGLIGPNGSGKTTLLNIVGGQIAPDTGSVIVLGEDVSGLRPELRHGFGLSRSFQDAHLFPGLTVLEAVQVVLERRRKVGVVSSMLAAPWVRAADRDTRGEASRILSTMGLTRYATVLMAQLSTGTRRIADLAMQVAARPKVLLLDEPTAGVAQRDAEAFGPLLRNIRQELDCAILIVEHDMPLLMDLCDRIYALEAGHVLAQGTPPEVRANRAVIASYLGADSIAVQRTGQRTRQPRAHRSTV